MKFNIAESETQYKRKMTFNPALIDEMAERLCTHYTQAFRSAAKGLGSYLFSSLAKESMSTQIMVLMATTLESRLIVSTWTTQNTNILQTPFIIKEQDSQ